MNGARRLAFDYIRPHLRPGVRVLDLCCGDAWLRQPCVTAGAHWTGYDKHRNDSHDPEGYWQADLSRSVIGPSWFHKPDAFDLIVSVYGLQHLLADEANGWLIARRALEPNGRMIYVGRYCLVPDREMNRQDPLNGHCEGSLRGLALATGLKIIDFATFQYDGDIYRQATIYEANAFCAMLRKL